MKICRIANPFPDKDQIKGDLGPNYYYLSKYAVEKGIDVHMVCGRTAGQKKYEEIDGIKIHRVSPLTNRRSYLYGEFAKKSFEKVKELKPDLIHGHTSIHFGCIRNRRKIDAPIITHYHGILDAYKHMDYLPLSCDIKTAVLYRLMIRSYFYENKYVQSKSDYIIAVSKAGADSIKKYLPDAKIEVVYNGVDINIFKHVESDIKQQLNADYLLLYVGRPMPLKGIQYLLQATKELNKKFDNLKVLLLGVDRPDSKVFCDWLRSIAKRHDLDNIIFSKGVSYSELPKYYSAADCFVLPSLAEGLGKVILEAECCSCPVVAADAGGISEIMNGKTGILCKPRDSQDLADKIMGVLITKKRFNGRKFAKKFSWEKSSSDIVDLYSRIIEGINE